jgi:hypothetical protein
MEFFWSLAVQNVFVNCNGGECQNTVSRDTGQCLRMSDINNVVDNKDNIF